MMIKFEELSSSIDELIKTRMRAEKEYEENLFIYACCPVGTDGKNETYRRIWLLARILGYNSDKVERDMRKAEKGE